MSQPPIPTDESLLAAYLKKGDRDALAALALRHEHAIFGLACGILHGREDLAVDAVQESWLRVIRFGDGFNNRSSFKTWLYRIVINQCRTIAAARAARTPSPDEISSCAALPANPAAHAEAEDLRASLRDALLQLDDDRRTLLLLCYHAGMTHEHAAEILEIPVGTLKSRLNASLTKLRAHMRQPEAAP